MRNASVDADYLRERGIVYCGTQGTSEARPEGVPRHWSTPPAGRSWTRRH